MTTSSNYSSLFALVDSHLSKTNLQENEGSTSLYNPPRNKFPNVSVSESLLPLYSRPRLPLPTLSSRESPIQNILAQQVANMLKGKEEKKQQEEKQKLELEMRRLKIEDEKNSVIDLMKAIQTPYNPEPQPKQLETLSSSSLTDPLFKLNFTDCDGKPERTKTPEPELQCISDMSYILKEKVKMGKCSSLGKVLVLRLKPVAAPYLREKIPTNIVRFDFSTPSPCDVIKENLKKPKMSCSFTLTPLI